MLPKYLSIETYAGLKTFLLYTSYVGILHFGYVDGIYIRYGGKEKEELYQGKFTMLYIKCSLVSAPCAVEPPSHPAECILLPRRYLFLYFIQAHIRFLIIFTA